MRKILTAALVAATLAGSLGSAQALPIPSMATGAAGVAAADTLRQDVQYYYYDRRYYRHRHHGGDVAIGVVGGLAAGALIAGAIASQQPLHRTQDPDYIAYCARKYRSFDPATGTFLARDGRRYTCE